MKDRFTNVIGRMVDL